MTRLQSIQNYFISNGFIKINDYLLKHSIHKHEIEIIKVNKVKYIYNTLFYFPKEYTDYIANSRPSIDYGEVLDMISKFNYLYKKYKNERL